MTDKRPAMQNGNGRGIGVSMQRERLPADQVPRMLTEPGGLGVQITGQGSPTFEGRLRAPFPYYGKGRWASSVWTRLGSPGVFVEPFLGSGAVLLAKPGGAAPREVVCDTNGHIANFYRALTADPDEVARWADWPTIHQDLTARHRWLLKWGAEHAERLSDDPEWYDPQAAGWWVWGISSWIGHGWCDNPNLVAQRPQMRDKTGGQGVQIQRKLPGDQRPHCGGPHGEGGGAGVQIQRTTLPVGDKMPNPGGTTGQGVQIQRKRMPVEDKRPRVNERGGQGCQIQRVGVPWEQVPSMPAHGGHLGVSVQTKRDGEVLTGERLRPWFRALAQRLARVIVLNRSWESAVTDSVLQQTPSSPKPVVAVFMDPPYKTTGGRSTGLYVGDRAGISDDVATASYEWAVEHGAKYRIAYACHAGDFPVPDGWEIESRGFSGHRDAKKKAESQDCVMFSPACVQAQGSLF